MNQLSILFHERGPDFLGPRRKIIAPRKTPAAPKTGRFGLSMRVGGCSCVLRHLVSPEQARVLSRLRSSCGARRHWTNRPDFGETGQIVQILE